MPRLIALGLIIFLPACGSHPDRTAWLTGSQHNAEALAGARAAEVLESTCGGVYYCPQAQVRLERIGSSVAVQCSGHETAAWQFTLLGSDKPNAFALPTNRVYLTRGLYCRIGQDDALLAAAIAHEMAHIHARDCFKPECCSPEESLAREQHADFQATQYLRDSGYAADSLPRLLRLIEDAQPAGWADARVRYITSAN